MKGLAIREVAERTGLTAATIRMWEQRYGFPEPRRTRSGYRVYGDSDVEALRRVVAHRRRGLSVPAAVERARATVEPTDRPSIYGAVAASGLAVHPHLLRKGTLIEIARAIEDEAIARAAGPVVVAAFQRERHYRAVEHRYRRLARMADAAVVFADFPSVLEVHGRPTEVPIGAGGALEGEWAVVVDAPGYAACLLAWEQPARDPDLPDRERRFEALWTLDPHVVRRAAVAGAALARRASEDVGERLEALLAERPLAVEQPAPALTALTNRMIGYLEAS